MTPTISVAELSRRYRDQAALDNVSLTVEPGTVTGLLGRNGAGKTTLLRIITGLEFPTSGEVKVFGASPNTAMEPLVGNSSPVTMRISVVLPAPLRPSSPVTVPGSTVSETSTSAAWSR